LLRHCSQQSRDVLDTSHKDERSHILGFVGDSPAHKDSVYGTGCVLTPPPPPRSCVAVTRTLPGGQVQTTLGEDRRPASACCWTQTVDRPPSTTAVDEGYSSRPPSYVVCAGGSSSAPARRADVTPGSAAATAATSGHAIYAVRRSAVCCPGDYSCCHSQLRHHHHHIYQQPLSPQQHQLASSSTDDDDNDRGRYSDAGQLDDEVRPAACQSSAGDDVTTSGTSQNTSETSPVDTECGQTDRQRSITSNLHAAQC